MVDINTPTPKLYVGRLSGLNKHKPSASKIQISLHDKVIFFFFIFSLLLQLHFMGQSINEATGKMTQLCRKIVRVNIKWPEILDRVTVIRRFFRFIWNRILVCSCGNTNFKSPATAQYHRLNYPNSPETVEEFEVTGLRSGYESDSNLVNLKISLLGDCQIGKTSFVVSFSHFFIIINP